MGHYFADVGDNAGTALGTVKLMSQPASQMQPGQAPGSQGAGEGSSGRKVRFGACSGVRS